MNTKIVCIYILSLFLLPIDGFCDPFDDCQKSKTCTEPKPNNPAHLADLFTRTLTLLANNDTQAFVSLGMTPELFEKYCPKHHHKQKIMEELKGVASYYQEQVHSCHKLFDWSKAEMISSPDILKHERIISQDRGCDGKMVQMNEVEIIYKVDVQYYAVQLKDPMRLGAPPYIYRFFDGPSCRALPDSGN